MSPARAVLSSADGAKTIDSGAQGSQTVLAIVKALVIRDGDSREALVLALPRLVLTRKPWPSTNWPGLFRTYACQSPTNGRWFAFRSRARLRASYPELANPRLSRASVRRRKPAVYCGVHPSTGTALIRGPLFWHGAPLRPVVCHFYMMPFYQVPANVFQCIRAATSTGEIFRTSRPDAGPNVGNWIVAALRFRYNRYRVPQGRR